MIKKKVIVKGAGKTSVKSYQQNIDTEKQKMGTYSKKFGATVRSLQANWKKYEKDMKESATKMREEGMRNMTLKVNRFKGDIKAQIAENKGAVSRISDGIKLFQSEIKKEKKDFQAYARGPFQEYIKAFWG